MAKTELTKVKKMDPVAKDMIKKTELSLDKGAKSLAIRQNHIKIADHSDLSWATVRHYMANPLADGLDDEKQIARSEKKAKNIWREPKPRKGVIDEVEAEEKSRKGCNRWT